MEKEAGAGTVLQSASSDHDPFGPDGSNYVRAETPSDAIMGMSEEISRSAHARYSFDGMSEGELPMSAGQEIEVLDDRDAAYVYSISPRTGNASLTRNDSFSIDGGTLEIPNPVWRVLSPLRTFTRTLSFPTPFSLVYSFVSHLVSSRVQSCVFNYLSCGPDCCRCSLSFDTPSHHPSSHPPSIIV